MLKILFDGYWWRNGPPSGRSVLRSIVHTWLEMYPDDGIGLAVPGSDKAVAEAELGALVKLHPLRLRPHAISNIIELPRIRGYQALFSQNFAPHASASKSVVFLHDLIFVDHPEWFTRAERLYLSLIAPLAKRSDVIITSSRSERERILRSLGMGVPVVSAGLSVPKEFMETAPEEPPVGLRPDSFLLTVGRLNSRKNLARLVEALTEGNLVDESCPLVIVGERDGKPGSPARSSESVRLLGGVSDAQLKWLYQHCRLVVFPSLDEGFGLPVLEAGLCGAPMAISDIPPFREIGDANTTVFFDPSSSMSIRAAVGEALTKRTGSRTSRSLDSSWEDVVAKCRHAIAKGLE